ncbi:kinase-like domain-containing protein, partial [Favolaschia claudopus]
YLVEPLRSSIVVEKYSGTVGGSDNTRNLVSSTMAAFTHCVLDKTACQLVFTDLQGSYHYAKPGEPRQLILFDPMTHSMSGNTGVGDHGPAGIQDTVDNHKCSMACRSMDLASMAFLKMTFKA